MTRLHAGYTHACNALETGKKGVSRMCTPLRVHVRVTPLPRPETPTEVIDPCPCR